LSGPGTFKQGEPPNIDGLFLGFQKKREKARVYTQFIYSIFTLDRDPSDLRIRVSHIWGWLSVVLCRQS